ncbi:carbohydrate kinase family protein [Psychrobacillus vulpis]|uniref:Carbohydrate kinase n=1 Tax=Psychrobacillus vulpis TaxID=2325572 RepID=A0A544TRS6_9BACI|nr:carbohydrate kinase [Psychrobacillus vulpis]TQR20148.1 carbohydrate kinase [Psychrobacillus vulpis]
MIHSQNKHVLIFGDAFVDYIAEDQTNKQFTKFLGGATVNVAAGISRLGAFSSFITITGDDETSKFVRDELASEGVDLSYAKIVPEKRVSGVYVHLTDTNDRIFHAYVDETPHIQVEFSTLDKEAFHKASVFHFCSGTLFHKVALQTTTQIVAAVKELDVLLSFDANIRPLRWESEKNCRETIISFFDHIDLLKLTEDELFFLMETKTLEEGIQKLRGYHIPTVLITVGDRGTYVVMNGEVTHVPVKKVEPVDTTGAGDAFMAGLLREIHLKGKPKTTGEWIEYISFGNKLGAICATKFGALTAMPRLEDLYE